MLRAAVVVLTALTALTAGARADVVDALPGGGTVDWSAGMVTATGFGLADRHAPSPAVARAASRRRADDDARAKLAAALAGVTWAEGGAPAELGKRDGWLAARAVTVDATLNPDGSWRVTMGVPIEAIRLGLAGVRALPAGGDPAKAPRAVVVDARAVAKLAPIGGVGINAAASAGATVWLDRDPPAGLVGDKPVKLTATAAAAGVISVDGTVPDLAGTLIVVVVRRP